MKKYNNNSLCFDDILLVPQTSSVESRHLVDLSTSIGYNNSRIDLDFPIIGSPMDTVCDVDMCVALDKVGGIGILHRYMPIKTIVQKTKILFQSGTRFGVSVGATNGYEQNAEELVNAGAKLILVDIANGHSEYAINAVKNLKTLFRDSVHIMAGNVSTGEGFYNLANAGADSVRVGIGGGSACTTRLVSGHGMPTLSSILDIVEFMSNKNISFNQLECSIIADGGIRNSGDMIKSFAAGADAVMLGSMLAGTDESPGEILKDASGKEVKIFRGMASYAAQKDSLGKTSVSEGISTTIPYKGSVHHIFDTIRGGIGSGCSYSGVYSIKELFNESIYTEVTPLSLNESRPHAG